MGLNALSPKCPECGTLITQVVMTKRDSRMASLVRRRHCECCGHRFYTAQPLEQIVNVKWTGRGNGSIPTVVTP
jgi:transcriptional regulator NrdR family protein